MIPYQKEKIENAICFFAREHLKKTKHLLYQTFLYKYLAFLDFESLRETGRPCLGLTYRAMERGPVPVEIYNQRHELKTPLFEFCPDQEQKIAIRSKCKPNFEYFSKYEIDKMHKLIEIFGKSYIPAKLISDASHEAIIAWKKTWMNNPNGIIDYIDEFDNDILNIKEELLKYPEESYLIYKALEA